MTRHKKGISTADKEFLRTLELWLQEQSDLLVLIRYSAAAGSRDYELFSSFPKLCERLGALTPRTSVIVFRKPQLNLRGVVDENFIELCLRSIPEGAEYLMVETVKRIYGKASWFHDSFGMSHAELREDLEDSTGVPVAVGLYPDWLEVSDDLISAIVPDENGDVVPGIY
jgi:hypothetical protein